MTSILRDACCANLPAGALPVLAGARALPGVQAALLGDRAWVRWPPGDERVLRLLLPAAGVVLYARREGLWYRPGSHLPAFEVPEALDYRPLAQVLTPAPVWPARPAPLDYRPVVLRLVGDDRPRPTAALRCAPADLARWADLVPGPRLALLEAACCGDRVLVLGPRLPPLIRGERFWGEALLIPLGRRPEPDLPESALREALGVGPGELVLLGEGGAEVVARSAFRPLTRAGLRLANGGG